MTNPESRSIELEELAAWDDTAADGAAQNEIAEADIRELSAYGFDSNDRTLVGIGDSRSAPSSDGNGDVGLDGDDFDDCDDCDERTLVRVQHFDSDDLTLVGIGPAKRPDRASRPRQLAETAPESARMPQSEPPGPFIASDDDETLSRPVRLPLKNGTPWALALPAALIAAAAIVVVRGVVPHAPASHAASPQSDAPHAAVEAPRAALEAPSSPPEAAQVSPSASGATAVDSDSAPDHDSPEPEPEPMAAIPRERPQETAPATAKHASSALTLGSLDISSNPPASVVLDGRPLGKAPHLVQVAPGPHTVVFVHPERGRMSLSVNVSGGRTTNAAANF